MVTAREARAVEWDELTSALNSFGVLHVAPGPDAPDVSLAASLSGHDLFGRLFRAGSVPLQEAAVLLLLTHPNLAGACREVIARLDGEIQERAMHRYVAAAALQRFWRTRIACALGPSPLIPPAYLDELGLPPLATDFGRDTLLALAQREEDRWGYDAWAGYTSLMDLFVNEIDHGIWGRIDARAS